VARHEAKTHQVTVEEKITELARIMDNVNFALFQGFYKTFQSRYELVVYILATLELAKAGTIKVYQEELNGPLWLYRSDLDAAQLPLQMATHDRPRLAEPPEMDGV